MPSVKTRDGDNYAVEFGTVLDAAGKTVAKVALSDGSGAPHSASNPVPTKGVNGFAPVQTFPATVAFISGDTSGAGSTNGTVIQVVAANPNRGYLAIFNNGSAEIEIWYGAKPADANVGLAVKKGHVIPAGDAFIWDARVPLSAIFATSPISGGLCAIEG